MTAAAFFNPPPPNDALVIWVVYRRPSDIPGAEYVVRPQYPDPITGQIIASPVAKSAPTLQQVRELIPGYRMLYRMDRQRGDDPVILETWF